MTVDRRQLLQLAGLGAVGGASRRKPRPHTYAQARTATGVGMARTALAAHFNPSADPITARPNDGSGLWPDFFNTGYLHYPGGSTLTDWTTGMTATTACFVQPADDAVIVNKRFLGAILVGYNGVGDRLTFRGCDFSGTWPNANLIQAYCASWVKFEYCTFRPAGLTLPPGNSGSIPSARTSPGTPYNSSWQYLANMTAGQYAVFDHCDVWGNAGIQMTGGNSATQRGTFIDSYFHDQADNDGSGGSGYHHDGIGPDSEGGSGWTDITHCTIASKGNTNAIALQGLSSYHDIRITSNYLSGFGNTVSIGATTPWNDTNITFTDNVMSADLPVVFGPLYGNNWNSGGGTNTWRRNRYQARAGDQATQWTTADHAKYWWPTDDVSHAADYTG